MTFWNYIGEFFLFRWIFSSHKCNEAKSDVSDTIMSHTDSDFANDMGSHISYDCRYENSCSRYDNQGYGYSQSYDDFHDEQEEYDMMDDDF